MVTIIVLFYHKKCLKLLNKWKHCTTFLNIWSTIFFSDFKNSFFKNKKKANSGSHLKFICQLLLKKRRLHLMQIVSQDVITKGENIIVTIFSSECRIFGWLLVNVSRCKCTATCVYGVCVPAVPSGESLNWIITLCVNVW